MNMGLTAEKLFSQTDFTKEDMDRWGVRSHQLASKAIRRVFSRVKSCPSKPSKQTERS